MPRLNRNAFADLIGVNEGVVRRAIKRGRISVGPDGMIDTDTEVARWTANHDPSKVRGRPALATSHEASVEAEKGARLRGAKTALEVQLLQEKLRSIRQENVNPEQVHRAIEVFGVLLRDKWMNFANQYGRQIAAEIGVKPKVLMEHLDRYVRLQLGEIANVRPTLPNGGVAGE